MQTRRTSSNRANGIFGGKLGHVWVTPTLGAIGRVRLNTPALACKVVLTILWGANQTAKRRMSVVAGSAASRDLYHPTSVPFPSSVWYGSVDASQAGSVACA